MTSSIIAFSGPAAQDADALAVLAATYFDKKEYVEALVAYEALCLLRPERDVFADRLAHCLSSLGRWAEARINWSQAIESHGANLVRINQLGRCLIELQDYAGAMALFDARRDQINPNANFFIYAAIACLGAGQVAQALDNANRVESLSTEKNNSAIDYFAWLLNRLVGQGHAGNVQRLLDDLMPSLVVRAPLLRTGIRVADALGQWEKKCSYARELIGSNPASSEGYIHYMQALLEGGLFDKCRDILSHVNEKFPRQFRSSSEEMTIESISYKLNILIKWEEILKTIGECIDFSTLNLRAMAHMTLQEYDKSIEVISNALQIHKSHPWFMALLGKCYEELGDYGSALSWFGISTYAGQGHPNFLINVCRVQMKAGLFASASRTLDILTDRHPHIPAIRRLAKSLSGYRPIDREERPEANRRSKDLSGPWLHGGDAGDLIYALAAMRAGGGGYLYLTSVEGTREPMTDAKIEFLMPLLIAQHYILGAGLWQGERIANDFTVLRQGFLPDTDLATQHWWCVSDELELDVMTPWLMAPTVERHGRPVFARSARYRNQDWNEIWRKIKAWSPDAIFVETHAEFEDFGHGEHYFAKDALDLACIIAGASVFIGNQSFPYALAEGMKVRRLLESSPTIPNCTFPDALALDLGDLSRILQCS